MNRLLLRTKARLRDAAKPLAEATVGAATIALLRTTRYFDPFKTADFFGRASQFIGRRLREDRIGRENLKAAFPEKSPEEIETILAGVWDNLGRIGAEFAHLDHIWGYDRDHPENSRIELPKRTIELFDQIRDDGKPALIFAISAIGITGTGRRRMGSIARFCSAGRTSSPPIVIERSAIKMGTLIPAGRDAPLRLAQALQQGQHVAMLVDQYLTNGGHLFGRKTKATRRPPAPAGRLPDPRHPHHSPAQQSFPRRTDRGNSAGARCQRRNRHSGDDAGGHQRHRRLGPRISGAVAMAAPKVAVSSDLMLRRASLRLRIASLKMQPMKYRLTANSSCPVLCGGSTSLL
jgi:KDO2-lipid IV(A) lauroyltransferase